MPQDSVLKPILFNISLSDFDLILTLTLLVMRMTLPFIKHVTTLMLLSKF